VQAAAARHGRAVLLYASRALIVLALLAALGALTWRNPLLSDEPIGRVPVLNWLLYAYGAPGLLLAAYAWRIRGAREERGLHFATAAAAVILLFAMVSLQTRHAFHLDDVREPARSLREVATYAVLWLAAALVTRAAAERWAREILLWTSRGLIVAALLAAAVTLTDRNPLWRAEWIGDSPALNWLLYAYGLPAALLCLCGLQLQARPDDRPWRHAVGPAALILLFALVTLETRRFFHHPQLTGPAPTPAEWYAYSAAWVGLGVALLIAGVRAGGLTLRWASLVVMLIAVGKVFLFDTAQLRDLYRVASLLGLGVSLMALAFIYQRYVFRRAPLPA